MNGKSGRRINAIHEAGRAVIAYVLSMKYEYFPFSAICATGSLYTKGNRLMGRFKYAPMRNVDDSVILSLAGAVAVSQVWKISYFEGCIKAGVVDWGRETFARVTSGHYTERELEGELSRLNLKTRSMVREYKPAILALADALTWRRFMTYDETALIIQRAMGYMTSDEFEALLQEVA